MQTKIIFGVGRQAAEYFAKSIGRVDTEAIKRDPKTETKHEIFEPISNQWKEWVDHIRFQPAHQVVISSQDGRIADIRTISIPAYRATEAEVEEARKDSLRRYGIPYSQAASNLE